MVDIILYKKALDCAIKDIKRTNNILNNFNLIYNKWISFHNKFDFKIECAIQEMKLSSNRKDANIIYTKWKEFKNCDKFKQTIKEKLNEFTNKQI